MPPKASAPAQADTPAVEWISGRQASLRSGLPYSRLLKHVAMGKVRIRALPGETVKYAAADIERLAADRA